MYMKLGATYWLLHFAGGLLHAAVCSLPQEGVTGKFNYIKVCLFVKDISNFDVIDLDRTSPYLGR